MTRKGTGPTRWAILDALRVNEALTAAELADATGLTRDAVNGSLHGIRQTPEVVYIIDWRRSLGTKGRLAPIYALGPGVDAPCPPALSRKALHARSRAKNRALLREKSRARRGHAPNPYLQLLKA